jgi:hypothetical protein
MISKKFLTIIAVAAALTTSSAFAGTDDTSNTVNQQESTTITQGNGFDVLNQTDSIIKFYVNGIAFGGTSPAHSYGSIKASWGLLKVMCFAKTKCSVEIEWLTPSKKYLIETTINPYTGLIGTDTAFDTNLPSLNATLTAAGVPLKAVLSNETAAGVAGREGFELVTVSPK